MRPILDDERIHALDDCRFTYGKSTRILCLKSPMHKGVFEQRKVIICQLKKPMVIWLFKLYKRP
jgi:hypothetical protein